MESKIVYRNALDANIGRQQIASNSSARANRTSPAASGLALCAVAVQALVPDWIEAVVGGPRRSPDQDFAWL
jgi:hypothetical protein